MKKIDNKEWYDYAIRNGKPHLVNSEMNLAGTLANRDNKLREVRKRPGRKEGEFREIGVKVV